MKAGVLVLPCIGTIGIMLGKLATDLQKKEIIWCVCMYGCVGVCTLHVCAGSNLCDTATVRHWEELKLSQRQGHLTLNCGPRQAVVWQKQKRNGPELGKVSQSYGRSGMGLDGIGIPKYNSLFWILSPPF